MRREASRCYYELRDEALSPQVGHARINALKLVLQALIDLEVTNEVMRLRESAALASAAGAGHA